MPRERGDIPVDVWEEWEREEPRRFDRRWVPVQDMLVADITGRRIDSDGFYVDQPEEEVFNTKDPDVLGENRFSYPVPGRRDIRFVR